MICKSRSQSRSVAQLSFHGLSLSLWHNLCCHSRDKSRAVSVEGRAIGMKICGHPNILPRGTLGHPFSSSLIKRQDYVYVRTRKYGARGKQEFGFGRVTGISRWFWSCWVCYSGRCSFAPSPSLQREEIFEILSTRNYHCTGDRHRPRPSSATGACSFTLVRKPTTIHLTSIQL